jgi:hypothetical protein
MFSVIYIIVCGLYRLSDRPFSAKLVTTFADRGCHVFSVMDFSGLILGFLNRSPYFFFQVASREVKWTTFQTHYFSENLVAPGIETRPLDL